MTMVSTYGLTHIHLTVADLDWSLRFYQELFGAEERFRARADLVFLRTPGSRDLIALHGNPADPGAVGNSAGVAHFGFQLLRPADLDEAVRVVEAAGGVVKERGTHRNASHNDVPYAHVTDPDGYVIELLGRDP
jgi:catechol 2,3-dioxygenase-like lactoylglutathione lyase family enzyme